jgi:alkylation response protein AidB-like acyl-CoA dehydrogenase
MDFTLTEEQQLIQQTARSLFSRECSLDLVKAAWEEPAAARPLWDSHLSDWQGIADQPLTDMTLFMEEHGRALAPGVFFPSLLAAYAAQTMDETLGGSATVAVAAPDGYWLPHGDDRKHFVPCAAQVDQVVVVNGSPGAPRLALVPSGELGLAPVDSMDRLRPVYEVQVKDAAGGREVSPQDWQRVCFRALVAVSAELVGVGRHLLESTVAYVKERHQFGRPVGSFQGLQWKLVDIALALERAAAAVSFAAMCVDAGAEEAARAVHGAKLEAGTAARQCARTGLQLHGGIGYTWEHGLHFWLRRAYAGDAFMGPADYHARCLADLVFSEGDGGNIF